ncbi:MAG: sensor histidine kinase, partial [Syntrophothermus sp.]
MKLNRKAILLIIISAFMLEMIIILYNQYTGFIRINSFANFIARLIIGGTIASLICVLFIYTGSFIINLLDARYSWEKEIFRRLIIEFFLALLSGIIVAAGLTLLVNIIMPYRESLSDTLITNIIITSVSNLILITAMEAVLSFKRKTEISLKAERLEKEISIIRFETLKNQLNPHFLFNSLNVLSALVRKDSEKAQSFIDEFSSVYRYILEVIDKQVVTLNEELEFARSYLFLQQIRFGSALKTEITISADKLEYFVPPLSIQLLLENALKHNKASADLPLIIRIYDDGGR